MDSYVGSVKEPSIVYVNPSIQFISWEHIIVCLDM